MGASMVIPPREDLEKGFALLKDLAALALAPEDIDAAYERQRQQAALTESEAQKYAEARAFMAQYDGVVEGLDERQSALESKEAALDERMKRFADDYAEKHNHLVERENAIGVAADAQAQAVQQLETDRAALESERRKLLKEQAAAEDALSTKLAESDKALRDNEDEKQRLSDLAAELDRRLKKVQLREQAADL